VQQHVDVDHGWIVNHSWMTFTHARYAFTLKTPARVHSAGNDVAHFVTSIRQLRSHVGSSRNRETRHFRPEDSTTTLFSQEGFSADVIPSIDCTCAFPDAIRFLCVSCEAHYYEQGVKYAREITRERTKVASLLGPATPSWFTTLITRGTTSR